MEPTACSAEPWDVILVGSGITALAFAVHAIAQRGPATRVLVLEKHYVPGGYASVFRRRRTRYDCSLHKLAGLKCGNTRRILDRLKIFQELNVVFHDTYFQVWHQDRCFNLPNDPERFKVTLREQFPQDAAGLDVFFQDVEVHGKNGYHQFQIMDGSYLPEVKDLRYAHRILKNLTVREALAERIQSPLLRAILGAPSVYAGGYATDLSYFYYLHIIYASLYCGSGYVVGGSQFLTNLMVQRVRDAGGRVALSTPVTKVLVNDASEAYGVETRRGTFLGRQIVLNCSPHYSLQSLLPELECLDPVRKNLDELQPSWSTTTLYCESKEAPEEFGLDEVETMLFPEDPSPSYSSKTPPRATDAGWEDDLWSNGIIMVTNYHLQDKSGGKVIQLNILDSMDHWPERGSAAYSEKKERCRRVLTERLYRAKPGLRGLIVRDELSSPHTYERYTNNFRGAGYGAMVGTNLKGHLFHRGFPIKNVHFMSSWVAGPSYEAALGYSEMRARTFSY